MNKFHPLISVIIPCFNSSNYIEETLKSVLNQSYSNLEILLVDDHSTDNTIEIIKSFLKIDKRIFLYELKKNNGGPAYPRNLGINNAKGEWIAFLDSDDIWHLDKLKIQIEVINQTNFQFCCTSAKDFISSQDLFASHDYKKIKYKYFNFFNILLKNRIPTSSVLIKSPLAKQFSFNQDKRYIAREDFIFWLNCHEIITKSIKINLPLVGYRKSFNQISKNKFKLIYNHFFVLKNYYLISGKKMSFFKALFFTFTHFSISLILISFNRGL